MLYGVRCLKWPQMCDRHHVFEGLVVHVLGNCSFLCGICNLSVTMRTVNKELKTLQNI